MSTNAPRFYHLSVRQKIYLGFFMMVILLVVLGGVSMWSKATYNSFLERFNALNDRVNVQIDVAFNVTDLQRHVTRFINEGHTSAVLDANETMHLIRSQIDQLVSFGPLAGSADLHDISNRLEVYEKTFQKVVKEKNIFTRLVTMEIPEIARDLRTSVEKLRMHSANRFSDVQFLLGLTNIQVDLLTYIETLDAKRAAAINKHFEHLRSMLEKEFPGLPYQPSDANRMELYDQLNRYEARTTRAIQALRGYLFLVNVVMAGEAAEVKYQTGKLQKSADQQKQVIRAELIGLNERMSVLLLWLTIIPISIGLVYAVIIARQITVPLSQITSTFKDLSKGVRVTHIPGNDRRDEIGELAHSANIFRQKNMETEDLLARADRLTMELKANQQALEASNSEMEQFVYTVSHDLKSPIVTSMGFIGIIRELTTAGRYDEAFAKLDRVEEANKRMGILINDLLDLSRAGRVDMEHSPADSGQLLHKLVDNLTAQLSADGFEVRLEGDFPMVAVNESRFSQIFENLISNSLKYGQGISPHGNLIRISCETDKDNKFHIFNFRDYGKGIPEEYHQKVFALFARLDRSSKGTGIGLTIVKKLTRYYGGDVAIVNPEGPGALFQLSFPVLNKNIDSKDS